MGFHVRGSTGALGRNLTYDLRFRKLRNDTHLDLTDSGDRHLYRFFRVDSVDSKDGRTALQA
jgi:hypothetical protein